MAKYQVWVRAEIGLDINAKNEEEARAIAEESWYEALQFNGNFSIDDIYCYEED